MPQHPTVHRTGPPQETSAGLQMPTALKAKSPGLGREHHEGLGHARLTHHCMVSNLSSARNSKCLVLFIHENWTLPLPISKSAGGATLRSLVKQDVQ